MKEDWIEIELGNVLKLKNGYAFKSSMYQNEGVPIIRISDINQGIVTADNAKRIKESEEYDDHLVEYGDILIAMSGATTGKFGIYKESAKTYQNQRVGNLKLHSDQLVSKQFIYYLLYSLKNRILKDAYGGAQPNISAKKIEAINIPLAPLPEQRAIVSKIDQLFSKLDNGIANLQAAKDKLEIYRQAVLKKAFEGGFTESDKWESKNLGDVLKISSGNGLTKANRIEEGPYLVYGGNGITGRHDNFMFEDRQLIIGRVGVHCGNTHITEPRCWVTDNAFVVTFDKEEISLECLYYLILSLRLNQYASSTAQPVISGGKVYPVEFLFPPKAIQEQLVQEIEARLSVCDNILANIEEALEKSEALRQGILKQAYEGKLLSEQELKACRQEPDWEPAEKLLERIKKKKGTSSKSE